MILPTATFLASIISSAAIWPLLSGMLFWAARASDAFYRFLMV
ncbi:hypothetical protein [Roseobacter denitrificans]|uniref:Uncharacterized protein n=1 Tax=Roseobacter denitrificans (strain ATCC 33942 / OCh 114) TaxID=375451 RepID=Q166M1_ROSDO|nr:hypothetical protein [Roseobacter denitrificans]ABG32072.1 hypothetical protein RD1_2514 [Roseobacter denitrificans OCh 114]